MDILLLDRDPAARDATMTSLQLQWDDCRCHSVTTGNEAIHACQRRRPDLVLMDIDLPDRDGLQTLEALRRLVDAPIVVVTARADELSQVRALGAGADDYLIGPVSPFVLVARVKALLRRVARGAATTPDIDCGDLVISVDRHEVTALGRPVHLTPVEFRLLTHLAINAPRVVQHQSLTDHIWGTDVIATPSHLKVVVSRIRAKLQRLTGHPYIETVRGVGYRLQAPSVPGQAPVGRPSMSGGSPAPASGAAPTGSALPATG